MFSGDRRTASGRLWWRLFLGAIALVYLAATVPHLDDFPIVGWAQAMIAAPAHKLATEGVYGSDMFTGFYRAESRNYDHMPLYPLGLAVSFRLLGLGVWQARIVSVVAGLLVLLLAAAVARRAAGVCAGACAAIFLLAGRLGAPDPIEVWRLGLVGATGVPLLDAARVIRFDVLVPAWVLAGGLLLKRATTRDDGASWVGAGAFAGLATLTHLYGAFAILLFAGAGLAGWRVSLRRTSLILAGWALVMLPYAAFVLVDLPAYRGQMLRHAGRFDLSNPAFYWDNLIREPSRYAPWFSRPDGHFAVPRPAAWLLVATMAAALGSLAGRIRQGPAPSDRLHALAVPVLAGSLAIFINLKRPEYLMLVVPFLACLAGIGTVAAWRHRWPGTTAVRALLVAAWIAVAIDGAAGASAGLTAARMATSHHELASRIGEFVPPGARVLASQRFWFALANREFRSINLALVLSDPQYRYPTTPRLGDVIDAIAPDFIVLESRMLAFYLHAPDGEAAGKVATQMRELAAAIDRRCPTLLTVLPARDYGDVLIHRCRSAPVEP
jgi:4-amino-4-deoxy-L-arabinose transferase-like glycosyltransferase